MTCNAITTRYLGSTNYKPSRIKAMAPAGQSVTLSYDDGLNQLANHAAAAKALAVKLNWKGDWVSGGTKDGYVFVNTRLAGYDFVTETKGA